VEVDHGATQIGVERLVRPQMPEPADASHEGLVDEVLGLRSVAGQEEGHAYGRRRVARVQLGQPTLARTFHRELRTPVHHR
jgi:hypothetical protein